MTRERFYPRATQHPGPRWKVRGVSAVRGYVGHSAEGGLPGLFYELARADRGAAWQFSCATDGRILQHYAVDEMVWHGGSTRAHNMVGVEHEGVAGQPLTDPQLEASVELARWLAREWGWGALRRGVNLFEHNEVSDKITACPSDRINWRAFAEQGGVVAQDYYVVRPGDTFNGIAARLGYHPGALAALNPQVADVNVIRAWQILRLVGGVAIPPSPATGLPPALDTALVEAENHARETTEAIRRARAAARG